MQLTHRFTLPASVEQAWTAFYFANRIAPCFPGATLTRVAGDEFDGVLKIKLGPTPLQYEGTATFLERSPEDQRIVVQAHGKDRRGHGTISVTVTMTFTGGESETEVEATSTAEFTGQGASFGQTVVQEASDRLVQRLIDCVSGKFAAGLGDLPSAEELATAAAAEHAPARQRAGGGKMSELAEPQEAVQPEPAPTAEVDTEREPATDAAAEPAPTADADTQPAPTAEVGTEREPATDADTEREPATDADTEREPATDADTEREPATEVDTERQPATDADTERQPTTDADTEPGPTTDVDTERSALDADRASVPHTDSATAASGVADGSAAPTPAPHALPATAGPQGGALATMVLPRVRRFGPPVLGAVVAVSVISGIVRRIRR
jgi:carbon monoxide dehydrogenase subunit G